MKKKIIKDESKVLGIIYFCDILKKEIILKEINGFSSKEQECEICGSHGSVSLYVNCECGKFHDIEINSW